jgi:hypothetical protein
MMEGYNVNIEPEANCFISEMMRVVEVPVKVIDNRDEKMHELVFFITIDRHDEYCGRDKISNLCHQLGYSVSYFGDALEKEIDCGIAFIKSQDDPVR